MLKSQALKESICLKGLAPHLQDKIIDLARTMKLEPQQILFESGSASDGIYFLLEGSLKVSVLSEEGDEQFLAVLGPGDVVGELSLIDQRPRSATVSSLKASQVAFLSDSAFYRFADAHPEVYRHILKVLSSRLRTTNDSLIVRNFLPLSGRLANTLLQLAENFGKPLEDNRILINHKISQMHIANMSGAARENVNRILNEWRKKGYISRVSGYYCIEDENFLKALRDV